MFMGAVVLTVAILQAGAPPPAGPAQVAANTAEIRGTLIDQATGKPVPGISLSLMGYGGMKDGEVLFEAISVKGKFPPEPVATDREGRFVFSGLEPRKYIIVRQIAGIWQFGSVITIRQGALKTPVVEVKKGQSLDLGRVSFSVSK